ncbi:hypothetical protein NBC122_02532 [Chryseobacterium salivictor]|uniref:Erythromycin esterase homolog n=2 Tax=Chryseobacterium salivictor TaxID=2547600 RepID=A0A4P6ZHP7_9FLAO|nr:hypothetical protein NBC122_02532 [Chryseobacterium salivictor]
MFLTQNIGSFAGPKTAAMKISLSEDRHLISRELIHTITGNSVELQSAEDLDQLIDQIGDAQYVLLGEASHGTHEYYTWRSKISKKLIAEKGFSFIAVEGDWPDCYRVNRYVKNYPDSGKSAFEVMHAFNRWPTWMWANWEVVALAEWMKKHNENLPRGQKAGFYGLDVYSLWESMEAILKYLGKVDPQALEIAKKAFQCFEPYSAEEGQAYARATMMVPFSCEREVIDLLKEIRTRISHYNTDHEAVFSAGQNAVIAVNAEKYYRTMVKGGPESWNIRDRHMMDTLNRLMKFHGSHAKGIIWEHNTHIGDARATDMTADGMVNVGQLVREQHGDNNAFAVGFGSYKGTVIAGNNWGADMRILPLPEAAQGSWEYLLHLCGAKDRIVFMNDSMKKRFGSKMIKHRAVGVVYHPEYEHRNYVPSLMPLRYDAFVYLDETKALHPLHVAKDVHQIPETYPFGV